MADVSKLTISGSSFDLKDPIARRSIGYGQVDSTSTSTAFTAQIDGVTSYFDGLAIMLRNGVVTSAAGCTLDINNIGAKPIYNSMADATAETTIFNIAYTMLFVYDSTRVSGGCWVMYRGYNSDTTSARGLIDYYFRPQAGSTLYRYKLCMLGANNRMYPIVTTDQEDTTQVSKSVQTVALRPDKIWLYNAKDTISAGSAITANTLYEAMYYTGAAYTFNSTISKYTTIYLRGTYNKTTHLFTLYDDGNTPCTSYYTTVPTNSSSITLSSYFVQGYYYILVGGAYSSNNYYSLFVNNPLYYFDGTNLIPVATKLANDAAASGVTSFNGQTGSVTYSAPVTDVKDSGGTSLLSGTVATIPSIPSATSDLVNDSGFLSSAVTTLDTLAGDLYLAKTEVGSASVTSTISAAVVTSWDAGSVTYVSPYTVVTGGTSSSISVISSVGTAATATYSSGILIINNGTAPTFGTAVSVYTSLSTGDSVYVENGSVPTLSYTSVSVPVISVSTKVVVTGISNLPPALVGSALVGTDVVS